MRFGTLIVMMLFVGNCLGADIAAPSGSHRILPEDAHLETLWEDGVFTEGVDVAHDGKIYFSDISRGEQPGRM
ncbi:MAG: hypothetical protein KDA80_21150, partial [Planctomycetaceae bacterium]|nr:hypothetical protein [Planctomycetaceae bacterium]